MHGQCVAFGTITQLLIEAAPKDELREVMDFCHEVGLPVTLEELGITDTSRVIVAARKACAEGESIHNMSGDVTPEQLTDAMITASLFGHEFYD